MEMGGFDMKAGLIQGRKVTPKRGQSFDNICQTLTNLSLRFTEH